MVGDRDRTEPFGLRVREQVGDVDRAIVRPRRVHVQVADDPFAARERISLALRATSLRQLAVEGIVLTRELRKSLPLGALAVLSPLALPQLVILRQPRGRGACELRLRS